MKTYNKLWRLIHASAVMLLIWVLLCAFLPGIELAHPLDIELRHFNQDFMESNQWALPDTFNEFGLPCEKDWDNEPERLEIEQVENE